MGAIYDAIKAMYGMSARDWVEGRRRIVPTDLVGKRVSGRMRFVGKTTAFPESLMLVVSGKEYRVDAERRGPWVVARINGRVGSAVCPYASWEAFYENWEEI